MDGMTRRQMPQWGSGADRRFRADGTTAGGNFTPQLSSEDAKALVDDHDNHVYFYGDVSPQSCLTLIRCIRRMDADLRAEQIARGLDDHPSTPIWLHIHSGGGSLFAGFNMADQLALIKSPIYSLIEGVCASAATMMAMACTRRYILPNSFMLVHQLSSTVGGATYEEFRDEIALQQKLMDRLAEFYARRSSLTADQIRAMLQRDYWMDAEACLANGFVDAIMTTPAV